MLGISAEAAEGLPARVTETAEPFDVWAENWPALRVFGAMGTQWRRAGMAGAPTGLDYAALPVVATALAAPLDEEMLARLSILEGAALTAMREQRP